MNGAHALIESLLGAGIDVCFSNPGTSEMHFVTAAADLPAMRTSLCLFEGVATGAADGYARVAGRTASTLMHLGPGLTNGMANLHNAMRARSPVVNIVGDHATHHKHHDSPLNSDIETTARAVSKWIARPTRPQDIGAATTDAVAAASDVPAGVATLILPADVSWGDGARPSGPKALRGAREVPEDVIKEVSSILASGEKCAVLLGGRAGTAVAFNAAARLDSLPTIDVFLETALASQERGGEIPQFSKIHYRAEHARAQLSGVRHLVLVDAVAPALFFAYPDEQSTLVPADCQVHSLCTAWEEPSSALSEVADRVGADGNAPPPASGPHSLDIDGVLDARAIGAIMAAHLPDDSVITDEAVTSGNALKEGLSGAPRHQWLGTTGGAIGMGLPLALGAAMASAPRRTFALQADGSAMYTIQALWTMARESLPVTTVILANRRYAILQGEVSRVGASDSDRSRAMLSLDKPEIDFGGTAQSLGVDSERVTTPRTFEAALLRSLTSDEPFLIEARI